MSIKILYEDENILAVLKPHNLCTIPSRAHFEDNLKTFVDDYISDPNFVYRSLYRLDKDTAGIVLIAKNKESYQNITINKKEYFALCEGNIDKKQFVIDQPIITLTENGKNILKREISPFGKKAVTKVEIIKNFKSYCLAKFSLETGRTHQIRVHMAHINHPLIGDSLYSANKQNLSHTFLILKKVNFKITNKNVILEIDFPDDWSLFLTN